MYLQLVSLLLDIGHARHSWFWGVCVCVCVLRSSVLMALELKRFFTFRVRLYIITCEIIHYNV